VKSDLLATEWSGPEIKIGRRTAQLNSSREKRAGQARRGSGSQPLDNVAHEGVGVGCVASAQPPRHYEFRVGAKSGSSPDRTNARLAAQAAGDVLILRVAEGPNLVALDAAAGHVAEHLIFLVFQARFARQGKQIQDRALGDTGQASGAADVAPLDQALENSRLPLI